MHEGSSERVGSNLRRLHRHERPARAGCACTTSQPGGLAVQLHPGDDAPVQRHDRAARNPQANERALSFRATALAGTDAARGWTTGERTMRTGFDLSPLVVRAAELRALREETRAATSAHPTTTRSTGSGGSRSWPRLSRPRTRAFPATGRASSRGLMILRDVTAVR